GVQTCALPISRSAASTSTSTRRRSCRRAESSGSSRSTERKKWCQTPFFRDGKKVSDTIFSSAASEPFFFEPLRHPLLQRLDREPCLAIRVVPHTHRFAEHHRRITLGVERGPI